jgi:acyl carrier protein
MVELGIRIPPDKFAAVRAVSDKIMNVAEDGVIETTSDLTADENIRIKRIARNLGDLDSIDTVGFLAMMPAQFDAWMDANVTTLAQARAALKLILRLVWKLYKAQE